MCAVSMVSQHYQDRYPQLHQWSVPVFQDYSELIRKAKLYDEMTKQPDCQDPKKAEFDQMLQQYMRDKYGLEPRA